MDPMADSTRSAVEREPLVITIPTGTTEATRYLVSAYCVPLAIRDSQEEAFRLCEDAERAQHPAGDLQLAWHPQEQGDDSPWELYGTLSGDEATTEYTVTPIVVRFAVQAVEAPQSGPVQADQLVSGALVCTLSVADNAPLRIIDARPARWEGRTVVTYEIADEPGSVTVETFRSECLFTLAGGAA